MRYAFLLILCLLLAPSVYGQDDAATEDTLDWRGYYPLEIGNVWEWTSVNTISDYRRGRREVISDTLIEGARYWVIRTHEIGGDLNLDQEYEQTYSKYLRYDMEAGQIAEFDTTSQKEHLTGCKLSAYFDTLSTCMIPVSDGYAEDEAVVYGGYTGDEPQYFSVGSDTVFYWATKSFSYNSGASSENYYYGIGQLSGIGERMGPGHMEFAYLRLRGKEYGKSIMTGIEEPRQQSQADKSISVYPNPTNGEINIGLKGMAGPVSVTMYDLMGRVIRRREQCGPSQCRLNTAGLSTGIYMISINPRQGAAKMQRVTVLK